MRLVGSIVLIAIFFSCKNSPGANNSGSNPAGVRDQGWALVPFVKADEVNPVLTPDTAPEFFCPVRKEKVKWEEKDVFNPAAVIRHDTVFLLYRAEDKIGKFAGTSRIGLAWSVDGLHFKKLPGPVLYPDNDSEKNMNGKVAAKIRELWKAKPELTILPIQVMMAIKQDY